MKKTSVIFKTVFATCIIFSSCKNASTNENAGQNDSSAMAKKDTTPPGELATFHFTYTIANLPPPLQVLEEFSKSNMPILISVNSIQIFF